MYDINAVAAAPRTQNQPFAKCEQFKCKQNANKKSCNKCKPLIFKSSYE